MGFASEKRLQEHLADINLVEDRSFPTTLLRREVPVGNCIPDIIIVRTETNETRGFWPKRWTHKHTHLVWLLRNHSQLSIDQIANLCYEPVSRISGAMHDMVRSGAMVEVYSDTFRLSDTFRKLTFEIIAIEAKLRNWREALTQARNYQRFANRTIVAMDFEFAPRDSFVLNEFKQHHVGLCAVSSSQIEWLIQSQIHEVPIGPDAEYLAASASSFSGQHLWSRR